MCIPDIRNFCGVSSFHILSQTVSRSRLLYCHFVVLLGMHLLNRHYMDTCMPWHCHIYMRVYATANAVKNAWLLMSTGSIHVHVDQVTLAGQGVHELVQGHVH